MLTRDVYLYCLIKFISFNPKRFRPGGPRPLGLKYLSREVSLLNSEVVNFTTQYFCKVTTHFTATSSCLQLPVCLLTGPCFHECNHISELIFFSEVSQELILLLLLFQLKQSSSAPPRMIEVVYKELLPPTPLSTATATQFDFKGTQLTFLDITTECERLATAGDCYPTHFFILRTACLTFAL